MEANLGTHFLSVKQLTAGQMQQIFQLAQTWLTPENDFIWPPQLLKHKTVANLFFEPSTRTRCSFELAAKRLGAEVLNFNFAASSTQKGETLFDTVDNLQALGVDLFVVRHPTAEVPAKIAEHLVKRAAVINAGDGCNEHPTQAMLDTFTIQRYKGDFSHLKVAIIGDVKHSRVANSDIQALLTLGVGDIRLVAPFALLPEHVMWPEVSLHQNMASGIADADVVIVLRLQRERMGDILDLDLDTYVRNYCLTPENLDYAKKDVIVMHPGPMNRGVEIDSRVADGPTSVILQQARFGVVVRMAIMRAMRAMRVI
jgi:aspartate carbamoyltransferase catalytic subunit